MRPETRSSAARESHVSKEGRTCPASDGQISDVRCESETFSELATCDQAHFSPKSTYMLVLRLQRCDPVIRGGGAATAIHGVKLRRLTAGV